MNPLLISSLFVEILLVKVSLFDWDTKSWKPKILMVILLFGNLSFQKNLFLFSEKIDNEY